MNKKAKIDVCLTCKRKQCTGSCARLHSGGEKPRKARREYASRRYEYQGEMLTVREISARCGIDLTVLYQRIMVKGWSMERATTEPVHSRTGQLVEAYGESHTIREWAEIVGLPLGALKRRFSDGWPAERALKEPLMVPRVITVGGEKVTALELARRLNIKEELVYYRRKLGWTGDRIAEYYGGRK